MKVKKPDFYLNDRNSELALRQILLINCSLFASHQVINHNKRFYTYLPLSLYFLTNIDFGNSMKLCNMKCIIDILDKRTLIAFSLRKKWSRDYMLYARMIWNIILSRGQVSPSVATGNFIFELLRCYLTVCKRFLRRQFQKKSIGILIIVSLFLHNK